MLKHKISALVILTLLVSALAPFFPINKVQAQPEPTVHYVLAISVSPTEALWGQQITISGSVNSSDTLSIVVSFHEPYKDISESVSTLASEGTFVTYWTPSNVGYWTTRARVDIADTTSASNEVEVVVKYSSPPLPTLTPSTVSTAKEAESIDWSQFWQTFKTYALWDLEWYDGSVWVSVKQDLVIGRAYPQPNWCKITLIFNASQSGSYRLTFAINKVVREYGNTTRQVPIRVNL